MIPKAVQARRRRDHAGGKVRTPDPAAIVPPGSAVSAPATAVAPAADRKPDATQRLKPGPKPKPKPAPAPETAPAAPGTTAKPPEQYEPPDLEVLADLIGGIFGALAVPFGPHWELPEKPARRLAKSWRAVLEHYHVNLGKGSVLMMAIGQTAVEVMPRVRLTILARRAGLRPPAPAPPAPGAAA